MNVSGLVRAAQLGVKHNSPAILTGLAIAGTVTTTYLAFMAGYKSARVVATEELRRGDPIDGPAELTIQEKAKICWPLFVPVAGVGALTIACALGANHVSSRRVAAMAGAYSLSEKAFLEYREKVVEQIGANKERKVREAVVQDKVTQTSEDSEIVEINGQVPCYDVMSGRYFNTTMETLRKAENDFNARLLHDNYASLNEFWDMIGLTGTSIGEDLGWTVENFLELFITTTLMKDGRPCLSLGYHRGPIPDYWKFH